MAAYLTGQNELPDHTHAFPHHPILHRQEQHTLLEKRHDKSLRTTKDIFASFKRVKSFSHSIRLTNLVEPINLNRQSEIWTFMVPEINCTSIIVQNQISTWPFQNCKGWKWIWLEIVDAFQGAIAGYIYRQGTLTVYRIPPIKGSLPCTWESI